VTLKEEHILRMFENRVLRRVFLDLRGRKWWEAGEDCIIHSS
jgi:hypothetical protein